MRSRALAVVVAVVVPLTALGVVIAQRGDATHKPARLPILSGGAAENATLGAARADIALYPYGGIVYKAGPNVPALDGSARAYKISNPDSGALRRLADAFGFAGIDPDADATFTDGEAQLTASRSGYWGYTRQSSGGGVSSSGVAVACAPDGECPIPPTTIPEHPADLPSQDDAKTTALTLLQRAGIDTDNATVTVDDFVTQWSVRVDPVVDGHPTQGLTTTVTIGERSVVDYASGVIGQATAADEYPLIGTSAAIDRLNKGEGFIGPVPMMATDASAAAEGGSAGSPGIASGDTPATAVADAKPTEPRPSPPLAPCDGSGAPTTFACTPIDQLPPDTLEPPAPQEITITGAEQVLLFAQSYTGEESWLVPAYRFTTSDGVGPTVLAIDDSFLLPPPGVDTGGSDDRGSGGVEPQPAPDPKSLPTGPPDTIEPGK